MQQPIVKRMKLRKTGYGRTRSRLKRLKLVKLRNTDFEIPRVRPVKRAKPMRLRRTGYERTRTRLKRLKLVKLRNTDFEIPRVQRVKRAKRVRLGRTGYGRTRSRLKRLKLVKLRNTNFEIPRVQRVKRAKRVRLRKTGYERTRTRLKRLKLVKLRNTGYLETCNQPATNEARDLALENDPELSKLATIPLVVTDISSQQDTSQTIMPSELSSAAGNAAFVGVGSIMGSILNYGSNLLLQRGFGAGIYGLYSLGLSLVSLIAAVFDLGMDNAMVRYVSIYRSKQKISSMRGLTIFCISVSGLFGIIGGLLVLIFAPTLAQFRHEPKVASVLQLMSPLVPLLCMQVIWFGGLQGFKAFKWRVLSERILAPIVLILLLGGVLLFHGGLTGIVLALLISVFFSMLFSLYMLFRLISHLTKSEHEHYELREWLSFAAPNFLTNIVDMILQSTDTLLLALFAISDVAIGQYTVAIKISAFISLPLFSLNAIFAPTIAELHSNGEYQKLAMMFKVVTKWTITLSLPIFLIAVIFSRSLLSISGDSFVPAWPLLVALSLGNMVNAGTGAVGYMLLMTGHQKLSVLNSLTAVIVNVVLGVILTPKYGAMGTAIATGLAVCAVNLMRLLQVSLLLKIHPFRWDTLKPVGAGVISATLTGGLLFLLTLSRINLLIQLVCVPVFLASYIGLLISFKTSPEDQIVVGALRKKLLRSKK